MLLDGFINRGEQYKSYGKMFRKIFDVMSIFIYYVIMGNHFELILHSVLIIALQLCKMSPLCTLDLVFIKHGDTLV